MNSTQEIINNINIKKANQQPIFTINELNGADENGVLIINTTEAIEHSSCLSQKDKIKTIILGPKVTKVGKSAFENYPNLQTVLYGQNFETVGKYAFSGCNKLTTFLPTTYGLSRVAADGKDIPEEMDKDTMVITYGLKNIEQVAFSNSGIKYIEVFCDNVKFRASSFEGCQDLSELRLFSENSTFGVSSFCDCPKLRVYVSNPSQIKRVAKYAFSDTTIGNIVASNQPPIAPGNGESKITKTQLCKYLCKKHNKNQSKKYTKEYISTLMDLIR